MLWECEEEKLPSRSSPKWGRPCWTPECEDRKGLGNTWRAGEPWEGGGFGKRGSGDCELRLPSSTSLDTWVLFPNYCPLEPGVGRHKENGTEKPQAGAFWELGSKLSYRQGRSTVLALAEEGVGGQGPAQPPGLAYF